MFVPMVGAARCQRMFNNQPLRWGAGREGLVCSMCCYRGVNTPTVTNQMSQSVGLGGDAPHRLGPRGQLQNTTVSQPCSGPPWVPCRPDQVGHSLLPVPCSPDTPPHTSAPCALGQGLAPVT